MDVVCFADVPLEIILTVAAGILVLLFVCIIALCVRWKLKGQHDVSNQAIYNQSTVSSSGGYATTKPHTRSSWTCTYKAGRQHQGDTHIWETPLPEPSADEYTLPTNMRQTYGNAPIPSEMLDSMEYTKPVSPMKTERFDCSQADTEYTQPVKTSLKTGNYGGKDDTSPVSENTLSANNRNSQANYYYYDPDSLNYMAPAVSTDTTAQYQDSTNTEGHMVAPVNYNMTARNNVALQETVNPVYKTLIRMDKEQK